MARPQGMATPQPQWTRKVRVDTERRWRPFPVIVSDIRIAHARYLVPMWVMVLNNHAYLEFDRTEHETSAVLDEET